MLAINDLPTFSRIVKVQVPVDGGFRSQSFEVNFRTVHMREMTAFNLATEKGMRGLLAAAVVAIREVCELVVDKETGERKPTFIAHTEALFDLLVDIPFIRRAMAEAYFNAVSLPAAGNVAVGIGRANEIAANSGG